MTNGVDEDLAEIKAASELLIDVAEIRAASEILLKHPES